MTIIIIKTKLSNINKMFKTLFASALIVACNAVELQQKELDLESTLNTIKAGDFTTDEAAEFINEHGPKLNRDNIEDFITDAGEQGFDFQDVKEVIEGAEMSGAFDKHDIEDFVLDACRHFQVQEGDLDHIFDHMGDAFGITEEQGQELLGDFQEAF